MNDDWAEKRAKEILDLLVGDTAPVYEDLLAAVTAALREARQIRLPERKDINAGIDSSTTKETAIVASAVAIGWNEYGRELLRLNPWLKQFEDEPIVFTAIPNEVIEFLNANPEIQLETYTFDEMAEKLGLDQVPRGKGKKDV